MDRPLTGEGRRSAFGVGPVVLCLLAALTRSVKLEDPDVWWHIATGRWLLTHRELTSPDPFAHTVSRGVSYSEVLADLLYALAYDAAGPGGVICFQVGLCFGLALLIAALGSAMRGTRLGSGALALLLGVFMFAAAFRLHTRTEVFSYLCFATELVVLLGVERSLGSVESPGIRGPLFWLPLLFLLWANLHRGVLIGLAVYALAIGYWAVRKRWRWVGIGSVSFGLCLLGASLNSGGPIAIFDGVDLLTRKSFQVIFPEWHVTTVEFALLERPGIALVALLWLLGIARDRRLSMSTFVAIPCVLLAVYSRRFTAFAVIAMIPEVGMILTRGVEILDGALGNSIRPALKRSLTTALGVSLLGLTYLRESVPSKWGIGVVDWQVPVAAAAFLKANPPPGKMYNSFRLGGYLVFSAGESQKVFIDGRNDTLYADDFFAQTIWAQVDPKIFSEHLRYYDISYAVLDCRELECTRYPDIWSDPSWGMVYLDDQVAVLVKKTPSSEDYLARHAYPVLRPHNALTRVKNLDRDREASALVADIERYNARNPDSARAHYLGALVARQLGHVDRYLVHRNLFQEIVRRRGSETPPP